ncbi:MAG: diaminopimelate epimerase [Prevotellaceae bacterium]|jgi:diaminopimelate epimerase|nr:diaminopimelate epimerase [Prevotellaceae bacterium]
MKFTKMHGAGNDYVYIDCTKGEIANPGELSKKISDRHFGVGSDGLVLICKSDVADFGMRMFNADGSEAQMCGNATRCIGKYVYDKGLTTKTDLTLETLAGVKRLTLFADKGKVSKVKVDMGIPALRPAAIPVLADGERVVGLPLEVGGETFSVTCISMGNPHAVIFVKDVKSFDVHRVGKLIENHAIFPEKVNVEFIEPLPAGELRMRVWERGSGETWACGSGACAALAAATLNNLSQGKATVHLLGGDLEVEWDKTSGHVYMTGGAETVFEGELCED